MKVVSYPDELRKNLSSKFNEMLREGFVAEGKYYSAENDYIKNINEWEAKGGIGIHHTSVGKTISELKKLGFK